VNNTKTRLITRTAILLALTIVFQTLGRYIPLGPNSNFVVGPLVNACLLIAAATGLWGGTAIAFISPFGAILTGAAIPLPFAPFIAIGNFLLVLCFHLVKKNRVVGIVLGAVLKFAFLYGAITAFVQLMKVPAKKALPLFFAFGWPQLVTALVGGVVALLVIKAIRKSVDMKI
jgi:uncharacterized membrane protein